MGFLHFERYLFSVQRFIPLVVVAFTLPISLVIPTGCSILQGVVEVVTDDMSLVIAEIIDRHNDSNLGLVLDYVPTPIAPPPAFIAKVKKSEHVHVQNRVKCKYRLYTEWAKSPSEGVIGYKIYEDGNLIATITNLAHLRFTKYIDTNPPRGKYTIRAVSSTGELSIPVALRVS